MCVIIIVVEIFYVDLFSYLICFDLYCLLTGYILTVWNLMLAITILLRIEFDSGEGAKILQESASFPTLKCRWGMCVWVFQLFLLAFKSTFTKVQLCQRFSIDARFPKFCSSVRKLCQPIASILVLSNESGKPRMNLFIHSFQYKMSVIRHICRCRLFSLLSGRKFIISCKNYKLKLFTFYCYWHPRAICLRTNGWNFSAFFWGDEWSNKYAIKIWYN